MNLRSSSVFCLVLLTSIACLGGEKHAIKISRPAAVGAKYKVEVSVENKMEMVLKKDAMVLQQKKEHVVAKMVADGEVLAVNETGGTTRQKYLIERCTKEVGEAPAVEMLSAGSILIAEVVAGKKTVRVEGTTLAPADKKLLMEMVSLETEENKDDKVMGTDQAQGPGDSWPINKEAAIEDLKKKQEIAAIKSIDGKVNYKERKVVDGQDCAILEANLKIDMVPQLPPNMKLTKTEMDFVLNGAFPVDTSKPALFKTMEMTGDLAGSMQAPDGTSITMETTMSQKRKARFNHK